MSSQSLSAEKIDQWGFFNVSILFIDIILQKKYPISLIGSSYDGVGINDAIMSSKVQIEKFVKMNKF